MLPEVYTVQCDIHVHVYIRGLLVLYVLCVQVLGVLYELEEFFMDIGPEVEGISSDEVDPAHIMKLVTILNKVSYYCVCHNNYT